MRYPNAIKQLMAMLILTWGGHSLAFSTNPLRTIYSKTPQQDASYQQGVSGHIAMLSNTDMGKYILMAGGCNFPDKPAAEGGAKRYYDGIYTAKWPADLYTTDSLRLDWQLVGKLPEAMAYAVYQPYQDGLIVAGGKSATKDLSTVYRIRMQGQGAIHIDSLPALPEPRSGMASAIVDEYLYLVGGAVGGKLSNSIIMLDLSNPAKGWQEVGHYPSKPFLKVLSAYHAPYLYVMGAFTDVEGEQGVGANMIFQRYNVQTKEWQQLPLPPQHLLNDVTFGGGYLFREGDKLVFSGGVRSSRFLPALQREQNIRKAKRLGEHSLADSLQSLSRQYLREAPEWHAFNGRTYTYDTLTSTWEVSMNHNSNKRRADAALITIEHGSYMLLGGELKPGIRTDMISIFPANK